MASLTSERIHEVAVRLRAAESGVRILRSLAWGPEVAARFFARGAAELPEVSYPAFDPAPVHAQVAEARRGLEGDEPVAAWLRRCADAVDGGADLLANVGRPEFLTHSGALYGLPTTEQAGTSALGLARTVDTVCSELAGMDLGAPPVACHLSAGVAQRLAEACRRQFGPEAPEVLVVEQLSSNALAGARRIQVRRDACFTDRDVHQLIEHEAFVHVGTSLNGRHQDRLPLLGASHPGTTRTQEGLAVFAEFITGTLEPDRFRRLADRVLATQMAIEGADFLDVYRFFLARGVGEAQAFESARRVFRGGVLSGGAPFTKDVVYLDGFLRVTNFLRAAVAEGRVDCLMLLFCGKLDLEDIPALAQLTERGLCEPPRFLPPWLADRRFLVTYLIYSSFLNGVRMDELRAHSRDLLAHAPRLTQWMDAGDAAPVEVMREPVGD